MTTGVGFALFVLLNVYTYLIPSRKLALALLNYQETTT